MPKSSPSHTASFIENIESIYVKIILLGVPLFLSHSLSSSNSIGVGNKLFIGGYGFILWLYCHCGMIASATPARLS